MASSGIKKCNWRFSLSIVLNRSRFLFYIIYITDVLTNACVCLQNNLINLPVFFVTHFNKEFKRA